MKDHDTSDERSLEAANALLRRKLQADHGMRESYTMEGMSPQLENIWLNSVFNFEENLKTSKMMTLFKHLGRPKFERPTGISSRFLDTRIGPQGSGSGKGCLRPGRVELAAMQLADVDHQRRFASERADASSGLVLTDGVFRPVCRGIQPTEAEVRHCRRGNGHYRLLERLLRARGLADFVQHPREHQSRSLVCRVTSDGLFQVLDAAIGLRREPPRNAEHAVRLRPGRLRQQHRDAAIQRKLQQHAGRDLRAAG